MKSIINIAILGSIQSNEEKEDQRNDNVQSESNLSESEVPTQPTTDVSDGVEFENKRESSQESEHRNGSEPKTDANEKPPQKVSTGTSPPPQSISTQVTIKK